MSVRFFKGPCGASGVVLALVLAGCANIEAQQNARLLSPAAASAEFQAMQAPGSIAAVDRRDPANAASLWTGDRKSLLGDRRALVEGDILTVVVEIDEKAEVSTSASRSRSGSESLALPSLFGLPQRVEPLLPDSVTLDPAVSLTNSSDRQGNGSVRRNEKLTLRVAAAVTAVMPNGVLEIRGSQEVRVNDEVRELLVSGYVRPADISRQNEITYDKIAAARISYGGRGDLTETQRERYGQTALDAVLPF